MLDENNLDVGLVTCAIVHKTNGTAVFNAKESYQDFEWFKCETHPEKPTIDDLGIWIEEYQSYLENVKYQKLRKQEYPDIGDQLDAIIKEMSVRRLQGENLSEPMDKIVNQCLAVKNKYPKPE